MKAHVRRDPVRNRYEVWIAADEDYVGTIVDGELRFVPIVVDNEPVEPTLVLGAEAFVALVRAGSDVVLPDRAMADHLKDAVAVRDRALGLVERIVDADIAREARP